MDHHAASRQGQLSAHPHTVRGNHAECFGGASQCLLLARCDVESDVGFGHHLLPAMFTDTSLFDGARTIIVECKWTSGLQIGRGGKKTLNEDHLRQLHTYMLHHARGLSREGSVEGLLFYPIIDEALDVELMLKGQRLRVRTINFAVDWPEIRTQLLRLLEDAPLIRRANQAVEAIAASCQLHLSPTWRGQLNQLRPT
jgi:hypothetical protein